MIKYTSCYDTVFCALEKVKLISRKWR